MINLILTDLLQLVGIDKFVAICWQATQAGEIDNLKQVRGVFRSAWSSVQWLQ